MQVKIKQFQEVRKFFFSNQIVRIEKNANHHEIHKYGKCAYSVFQKNLAETSFELWTPRKFYYFFIVIHEGHITNSDYQNIALSTILI